MSQQVIATLVQPLTTESVMAIAPAIFGENRAISES